MANLQGSGRDVFKQPETPKVADTETPIAPSLLPPAPLPDRERAPRWKRFGVGETLELDGVSIRLKRRVGSEAGEAAGKSESWMGDVEGAGGKSVFVKRFSSPRYPDEEIKNDPDVGPRRVQQCHRFERRHGEVMDRIAVDQPGSGGLVKPLLFGRPAGSLSYVKVYPWISDGETLDSATAQKMTPSERLIFLRTLFLAVWELHSRGVAHGDIKRENVLVVRRPIGRVARLIDIDEAFLDERGPNRFEDLETGTDLLTPEWKILEDPTLSWKPAVFRLGTATDMFQLAVMLHDVFAPRPLAWLSSANQVAEHAIAAINRDVPTYMTFDLGDDRLDGHVSMQLAHCLRRDPSIRPTIYSLLSACGVNFS